MPRIPAKYLKLGATGLVLIALNEAYRGNAYLDTVGVPTIGYGETKDVKMGDKITPERALSRLLVSADDEHGRGMRKCLGDVPLHQYEHDAYLSFTYNIGVSGFCRSETLKRLKEGKYEEACHAMMGWKKPPEIIGRREREVEACLHGGNDEL